MKNYDQSVGINHHLNWSYISDQPYGTLIISGSGSGKTNVLLKLIKDQRPHLIKFIYMSKIHSNQRIKVSVETENLKNPKSFVHYSQTIDDVYENLEDYNPTKKRRMLIVFDIMIVDMESMKN